MFSLLLLIATCVGYYYFNSYYFYDLNRYDEETIRNDPENKRIEYFKRFNYKIEKLPNKSHYLFYLKDIDLFQL